MEHDLLEIVFLGNFLANIVTSFIWGYILLEIAIYRNDKKNKGE